jgi:hypothetical protein
VPSEEVGGCAVEGVTNLGEVGDIDVFVVVIEQVAG